MKYKEKNNKSYRIIFRVTIGEYLVIKQKSLKVGFGISEYLRKVATNKEIVCITDIRTMSYIRLVGCNLNEIKRKMNSLNYKGNLTPYIEEITIQNDKLRTILDELEKLVHSKKHNP